MSTLKADTIVASDGSSPVTLTKQSAAKAWNRTSFSGGSPSLDDSFNVSSLTDPFTGGLYVNYSSAFSDANFAESATSQFTTVSGTGAFVHESVTTATRTSSVSRFSHYENGSSADPSSSQSIAHGDLA